MPDLDVAPLIEPGAAFIAGLVTGVLFSGWLMVHWLRGGFKD